MRRTIIQISTILVIRIVRISLTNHRVRSWGNTHISGITLIELVHIKILHFSIGVMIAVIYRVGKISIAADVLWHVIRMCGIGTGWIFTEEKIFQIALHFFSIFFQTLRRPRTNDTKRKLSDVTVDVKLLWHKFRFDSFFSGLRIKHLYWIEWNLCADWSVSMLHGSTLKCFDWSIWFLN